MTIASATSVKSQSQAAKSTNPTVRLGSKGSAVMLLQKKLSGLGYKVGTADGVFGPKTLAAVKAFQKRAGIAQDGVVGPQTWSKLSSAKGLPSPMLKKGAKGSPVKALQQRLAKLGFNPGGADGIFGDKTAASVKAFQKKHGLSADGVVGPQTWSKLGINPHGTVTYPGGAGGVGGGASGGSLVTGYVNGVPRSIRVSAIPNGKVLRSDAAAAYNKMYAAARAQGITLTPVSGFRTMAQQQYLYQLYLSGKGNLAAKPGYSNHQGGIATDISVGSTASSAYQWLAAHGAQYGFRRTVPSEPWHWEYRP